VVDKAVLLNDKPAAGIKRKLRVTYAKREEKREITGNVAAARTRLSKKQKTQIGSNQKHSRTDKSTRDTKAGTKPGGVVEGKRATKDKSGGSGFKVGKKRGKMRLVENNHI